LDRVVAVQTREPARAGFHAFYRLRRCPAGRAGRMRRSPSLCGYRGQALRTKCARASAAGDGRVVERGARGRLAGLAVSPLCRWPCHSFTCSSRRARRYPSSACIRSMSWRGHNHVRSYKLPPTDFPELETLEVVTAGDMLEQVPYRRPFYRRNTGRL
jgi:hypothetical protein